MTKLQLDKVATQYLFYPGLVRQALMNNTISLEWSADELRLEQLHMGQGTPSQWRVVDRAGTRHGVGGTPEEAIRSMVFRLGRSLSDFFHTLRACAKKETIK